MGTKSVIDFPSITELRISDEVKCHILKTTQLGRMWDRSNVSHLSASSGRTPHFRLTPRVGPYGFRKVRIPVCARNNQTTTSPNKLGYNSPNVSAMQGVSRL